MTKNDEAHRDDITIEEEAMAQFVRPGLAIGHTIPDFKLQTADGKVISPIDYKEKKNLVVIFFDDRNSQDLAMLSEIGRRYHEFTDANAEVLAIANAPIEEFKICSESLRLPFPCLADVRNEATCAYCVSGSMLFVADKFGELRMQSDLKDNIDQKLDEALSTIELAELECPECGVRTWPME